MTPAFSPDLEERNLVRIRRACAYADEMINGGRAVGGRRRYFASDVMRALAEREIVAKDQGKESGSFCVSDIAKELWTGNPAVSATIKELDRVEAISLDPATTYIAANGNKYFKAGRRNGQVDRIYFRVRWAKIDAWYNEKRRELLTFTTTPESRPGSG